jgi:hypothetical protein
MISKETLTTEWLNKISEQNGNADLILLEKVIRALFLLEGLAESGLPFVFKGGTALMLMLGSTRRLSIDIDIMIEEETELDEIFHRITELKDFLRFEIQRRNTVSGIKKAHYKFYYTPISQTRGDEEYVLLDILIEKHTYQYVRLIPIESRFLKHEGELIQVHVPSIDDILGDKLTAFAPNTTGIPYEKGDEKRGKEIIKQLYDIGTAIDVAIDVGIISKTFHAIAKTELGYRNTGGSSSDVLSDIYETALLISTSGIIGKGDFKTLQTGITQTASFIFSGKYHLPDAITHAAKAAYLSKLIQHGKTKIEHFTGEEQVSDWIIGEPLHSKLNKLKKTNVEAFFYWYKIYEMEKELAGAV